ARHQRPGARRGAPAGRGHRPRAAHLVDPQHERAGRPAGGGRAVAGPAPGAPRRPAHPQPQARPLRPGGRPAGRRAGRRQHLPRALLHRGRPLAEADAPARARGDRRPLLGRRAGPERGGPPAPRAHPGLPAPAHPPAGQRHRPAALPPRRARRGGPGPPPPRAGGRGRQGLGGHVGRAGGGGGRARLRRELGARDDQVVVGMVGRLVAEKGLLELFEAARLLDDRYLVVVAGPDDPEKPDALDRATIRDAEARGVRFLGMREDVDRLYGAMDLFVLPSWREGFPRAAMEAAASGLPVIATDVRGCRQVVDDGVTGLLVPVRDPVALAAAIRALGEDEERRRAMGRPAVERALAHFDERRVVEIVLGTYREVAARKGLDALAAALADPAP